MKVAIAHKLKQKKKNMGGCKAGMAKLPLEGETNTGNKKSRQAVCIRS